MTLDVSFYQLLRTPLEKGLPKLIEKVYLTGLRANIICESIERVEALNTVLWTFSPGSFLPHGYQGDPKRQPIWLSTSTQNVNDAHVAVVTNGVVLKDDIYERCIDIFDGNNPQEVQAARDRYRDYSLLGCKITFWKQDSDGNWTK